MISSSMSQTLFLQGSILESKAQVSSFCLELAKKLDMRYQSPPLPVDLAFNKSRMDMDEAKIALSRVDVDPTITEEVAALFQIHK
jgi:hypothetical protein